MRNRRKRQSQDDINKRLVESRSFCEKYLTKAIGIPLRIEKVANMITIFSTAPTEKVAEFAEQELLASSDPVEFVRAKIKKNTGSAVI